MKKLIFVILIVVAVVGNSCNSADEGNSKNSSSNNETTKQELSKCEKVKRYARKLEGRPYVWGGEFRNGGGGDCSGFIYWIQMRINHPVPRTTARKYWLMASGNKRHWKIANCTDWVWWQFDPRRPYGHIGIMVENPKFWQSGSSSGVYSRKFFEGSFWDKKFKGTKQAAE